MATVNLGAIKFNWKGAYAGSTAYAVDDVVSSGGSSYVCILASTGNAVSNGTYWELMSSAGTNGTDGTDLSTTITTQGDILYRDGSGLQRLAKGTAGQVLQMNSGATAPEYGTVSSDFVKIQTQEVSSSTGSVTFKSFASSIYGSYACHITDLQKTGTSDNTYRFRWVINNGGLTSGTYRNTFMGHHFNSASSNNENYGGNWNSDHIQLSNWNAPDTRNSGEHVTQITLNIGNLSNGSHSPVFTYERINPHPSNTYTNIDVGGGYHAGSETQRVFGTGDGFQIFPAGDAIGNGIFTLYGRKK